MMISLRCKSVGRVGSEGGRTLPSTWITCIKPSVAEGTCLLLTYLISVWAESIRGYGTGAFWTPIYIFVSTIKGGANLARNPTRVNRNNYCVVTCNLRTALAFLALPASDSGLSITISGKSSRCRWGRLKFPVSSGSPSWDPTLVSSSLPRHGGESVDWFCSPEKRLGTSKIEAVSALVVWREKPTIGLMGNVLGLSVVGGAWRLSSLATG